MFLLLRKKSCIHLLLFYQMFVNQHLEIRNECLYTVSDWSIKLPACVGENESEIEK